MSTNIRCEHGPESRMTADGTPIGRCTDCTGERSYFGDSDCGACFVGKLHTIEYHAARIGARVS